MAGTKQGRDRGDALAPYRAQRDFGKTAEPAGRALPARLASVLIDPSRPEPLEEDALAEPDDLESCTHLLVDESAAPAWAANFDAVQWHDWTSLVDAPLQPTYALVDLTCKAWASRPAGRAGCDTHMKHDGWVHHSL